MVLCTPDAEAVRCELIALASDFSEYSSRKLLIAKSIKEEFLWVHENYIRNNGFCQHV